MKIIRPCQLQVRIYIYIYIYTLHNIYIYIYRERERERERVASSQLLRHVHCPSTKIPVQDSNQPCVFLTFCCGRLQAWPLTRLTYIYIYTHTHFAVISIALAFLFLIFFFMVSDMLVEGSTASLQR
jgi:hypothetical protein